MITDKDREYMKMAMALAKEAEAEDEVPVGAIIVRGGEVIAKAHNTRQTEKIATRHAEISVIEEACRVLHGWRLPDTTLYVTMEPCVMCAGAVINARIPRVVFGVSDVRFGAFGSLLDLSKIPLNHKVEVEGGVFEDENRDMLSAYFKRKREKAKDGE